MIVSVLVGLAGLSVSGGRDRQVRAEANRVLQLLVLASEEAILQGEEMGLLVDEQSYRFLRFDVGVTDGSGQLFAKLPSWRDPHKDKDPVRVVFVAQKRGHQLTRSGFDGLPFHDSQQKDEVVEEVRFTMDPRPERRFRLRLSATEAAKGERVRLREQVLLAGASGGFSKTELVTTITTDEAGEFTLPQLRGPSYQDEVWMTIVPLSTALRDRFVPESPGFPASPSGILLRRSKPRGEGPHDIDLWRLRRVDLRLVMRDGTPASSAVLVMLSLIHI